MTGGIIEVYAKCPYCGADGVRVKQVIKYAQSIDAEIIVHKLQRADETTKEAYNQYLNHAGMKSGSIVVFDKGKDIVRLDAWKP